MPTKNAKPRAVHVCVVATESNLDREDQNIEGQYVVTLPGDVDDAKAASVALDVFHSNVPIGMLDHFSISATTPDGRVLEKDPAHESYSGAKLGEVSKRLPLPAALQRRPATPANEVTLDITQIAFKKTADGGDPGARLLATIWIAGVAHYLEGFAVEEGDGVDQEAIADEDDFELLHRGFRADGSFSTTTIDGREYVLFLSPQCK